MSNTRFNLDEYFTHIGLPGYHPEPTLACLREIVLHHTTTFPYQSSRLFQEGKKPAEERKMASLDPDVIFHEMVKMNMPAYCYQNNGLLQAVLARIGFIVTAHLSKVILEPHADINTEETASRVDSHITLVVTVDACDYVVDSGFANENLRHPVPLTAGIHELECDDYQVEEFSDHWRLNTTRYNDQDQPYWFSLYRFDKHIANTADIDKAHHDLYFAKNIPIRSEILLFAKTSYSKRKFACWSALENSGIFRSVNMDGSIRDVKKFDSEAATVEFAKKKFAL